MSSNQPNENYYLEYRCPRCAAWLMSNGELIWCSLLDGDSAVACEFGHDRDIPMAHLKWFHNPPEPAQ